MSEQAAEPMDVPEGTEAVITTRCCGTFTATRVPGGWRSPDRFPSIHTPVMVTAVEYAPHPGPTP